MQTIGAKSLEKMQKIVDETLQIFLLLAAVLEVREIEIELSKYCLCTTSNYNNIRYYYNIMDNFQLPSLVL
jgi:(p)ppGpp synthase/HD superfamily hydrolase